MAIVKKYNAKVVRIVNRVEGIYTVEMKSLNGPFKYFPGQFLHLALDKYDPSSGWPESRCFSIQSSTQEENILITYAIKGLFTTRMSKELKPGSYVALKLPYGDLFTQEHSKSNTIFIAGGTGITPFLSLFTDPIFQTYKKPKLFFGLKNDSMNLYKKELGMAMICNPELKIEYIYHEIDGNINIENIIENETRKSSYYVSGPPGMIKNLRVALLKIGIAKAQIKTDEWE